MQPHPRSRSFTLVGLVSLVVLALVARPAPAKPNKDELERLLGETDKIAQKVSTLRGLPIKTPIARGIMSREQIEQRVLALIDQETSPSDLAGEERAAKRFGFVPVDADYKQLYVDLLTEQIAGFYDPSVKELYLADWIDVSTQRMVMAHELVHALQDQSFDLHKFTDAVKGEADAALARQSVVEGDGVAAMIEFMFLEMGVKVDPWVDDTIVNQMGKQASAGLGMAKLDKAPLLLRESLMFPYMQGLRLVATTRRNHPWKRVDEMFKNPPQSTEQVLHPEKYFAGEKPVKVKSAALPSLKKWKVVEDNVLGEAGFGWLLRQHGVKDARARDAAAGWGGDRYALYAPPDDDGKGIDRLVLVSLSAWDSETDALEAFTSLVEAMPTWSGVASPVEKSEDVVRFQDDAGKSYAVARKGNRVLVVVGSPKEAAKIRQDVWARWK